MSMVMSSVPEDQRLPPPIIQGQGMRKDHHEFGGNGNGTNSHHEQQEEEALQSIIAPLKVGGGLKKPLSRGGLHFVAHMLSGGLHPPTHPQRTQTESFRC
jgi:hypothetical protein